MAKPTIRHVALYTKDTELLARFYTTVFDMKLMHQTGPGGGYHITDGTISFAILPERSINWLGMEHFGFLIEDTQAILEKMVAAGARQPEKRPPTRPFAEFRGHDLYGNPFDLSEHGYMRVEYAHEREGAAGEKPEGAQIFAIDEMKPLGRIRQINTFVPDPPADTRFYKEAFELEVIGIGENNGSMHLTDGYIDFTLMNSGGNDWVKGIHHIGIEIDESDYDTVFWRLIAAGVPAPIHTGGPFDEYRCRDIFGNPFTISTQGFAVSQQIRKRAAA
jgi:catechol 2,3-dioxygenase-like lactoylglutathione lyase family enzyme